MFKPFALIIEDDRDIAALFRHALDLSGFQTEIAFHGSQAVERLSNCQPDIAFLDLNLPGVSGKNILEMIRKEPRLSQMKVVVVTAHAEIAGGLSQQPDLLLLKPVSVEQLTTLASRMTLSEESPRAVPFQQEPWDGSTGLYNQDFFKLRLESSLKKSRETDPYLYSVILFNIEPKDRMKNAPRPDHWEETLREIADALKSILRPTDTLARFDKDTFYVLIENVPNKEICVKIANRIQEILYERIPNIDSKIRTPIRIGILICDRSYEKVDLVLGDAKYALSLAIAQGDEYAKYYYQVTAQK